MRRERNAVSDLTEAALFRWLESKKGGGHRHPTIRLRGNLLLIERAKLLDVGGSAVHNHLYSPESNPSALSWLNGNRRRRANRRLPASLRLRFEFLEDRRMLAFGTPLLDVAGIDAGVNPPDTVGEIGP